MSWQPTYIKRFHECVNSSTGVARVLTDAGEGFIKPLGNAMGPHALVREWVGTAIAKAIGLVTFEFAIMDVDTNDDIPLGHNKKALPGPAFITAKQNGFSWGGSFVELQKVSDKNVFSQLVVLDTLILNPDRCPPEGSPRKINLDNVFLTSSKDSKGEYTLIAFDHSDCLRPPAELSPTIKSITNTKDNRIYGLFPEFKPFITCTTVDFALEGLKPLLSSDIAERTVESIPSEWDVGQNTRTALAEFVRERALFLIDNMHGMISAVCEKLIV